MRTFCLLRIIKNNAKNVGMKPLSERDENLFNIAYTAGRYLSVGMKPLSERDENIALIW